MDSAKQQIVNLQHALAAREDQINQLSLEADGAARAIQAAQAEKANAEQLAQHRAEIIDQLQGQIANSQSRTLSPTESVLNKLRTPNILRDLPCFDGNPVKLHQFLRAIDNIMPIIDEAQNTPMHSVWIQCIRSKIIGEADTVMELYGTELEWDDIKTNLINHYNDKRDEVSLTRDLFKLSQMGTVEEFYGKISHIISLLINQLCLSETNVDVITSKKQFYQDLGLKVFVAGLKEPLGPIIRAQAPQTMKEALRLCSEESNYNYVKNPFKTHTPPIPPKPQFQLRPQFQPRPAFHPLTYPQFNPIPRPNNFHPQPKPFIQNQNQNPFKIYSNPNPFKMQSNPNTFNQFRQQSAPIQNVFAPRYTPQPKPVPMDVDPSMRSRRINYMNRPHFHLEHDPYVDNNYPQYEDSEFYYYPEYSEQQPYYEPTMKTHEVETPTPEPIAETADAEPKQIVDDLNFQVVNGITDTT